MHDWRERVGEVRRFLTNRILIMGLVFIGAFCVLVAALFDAQIVNGHISVPVMRTHSRYIALSAPRGEIFDAFGRPLAVNLPVSVVKIDPSQIVPQPNEGLIFFMELMARHEQEISVDSEFLISETVPRYFSGSAANWRRWLRDFHIYDDLTAEEAYEALLEFFAICEYLPDAHTLLQLRAALHLHRFSHNQITLAWDIPEHTIMAIGENAARMAGIYVDQAFLRIYPEGRYTSHIVGWLGLIEAEQYQANRHLGYTATDLFGRAGAENAFEHQLRGTPGRIEIEVNSAGRRVATLSHQPPVAGNDIFLTICAHLQRYVYYALEDTLARVLLNRLNAQRGADQAEFVREVLASLVRSNNLPMRPVLDADEYYYPASFMLAGFVRGRPNLDPAAAGFIRAATDI
ncbi:MAG: hypothetical protein FWB71_03400, partial [Defluviitaleaceae bacterium]|nr:hypothetical protein [Defluviitaleaceae bacterium]